MSRLMRCIVLVLSVIALMMPLCGCSSFRHCLVSAVWLQSDDDDDDSAITFGEHEHHHHHHHHQHH